MCSRQIKIACNSVVNEEDFLTDFSIFFLVFLYFYNLPNGFSARQMRGNRKFNLFFRKTGTLNNFWFRSCMQLFIFTVPSHKNPDF